jgi:transcriptional regulator with XRE-family HTH domain
VIIQDLLYSHIGQQLKSHREKKGLTQSQLAERVGLERTSITNIESGKQRLPLHILFGVCHSLGVSPVEVMPRVEQVTESSRDLQLVSLGHFQGALPRGIAALVTGKPTSGSL